MCGICGIANPGRLNSSDLNLTMRMIGRLSHRGPDGSGYYRDRNVILGHARLAIIDVEGGAQPLCNEDESLWITFNGEIYNYRELSKELASKGHNFRTQSDTEVIIHAFEEWGLDCFNRFNGQWALALWDRKRGSLALSRDRLGIRPLYYTFVGDTFLFSSEIKALFAHPKIERSFDPAGLAEVFTFWSTVAPRTVFSNVHELKPGYVAQLQHGKLVTKPYWTISFPIDGDGTHNSIHENAKTLREHLIEASRLRFTRSDVPVGAYLSGGIDSSVTASIINNYTDTQLNTYSMRFSSREFDEGQYQSDMISRLGTHHSTVTVSPESIGQVFPTVVWHTERPILRSAPAPLYLLSKLVKESGFKVVVTGEGSDEVLAGYDIFREAKVRLFISRNPESAKRMNIVTSLYPWMTRSPNKIPAFAHAFFSKDLDPEDPALSHRPRWNTTTSIQALFHPDLQDEMKNHNIVDDLLDELPTAHSGWDMLCRAQWLEYTTLLSGYILSAQGDRMLMANSVEGRFPFLDCNLVDFANQIPAPQKLFSLDEKHILKVACKDLVPQSILQRPKQPYRAPDAASFFTEKNLEWVDALTGEEVIRSTGLFHYPSVKRLVEKCRRTQGVNMSNTDNMRIVGILSTLLAHHHFIEQDGRGESDERPPSPVTAHEFNE